MKDRRQSLGRWGEQLAAAFLQQRGYQLVAANARTPYGELDLVTRQNEVTVFVEVKTRSSTRFGLPEEAVTAQKRAHLLAAAQAYLEDHPDLPRDWRVDVIAILHGGKSRSPEIIHFENAVNE